MLWDMYLCVFDVRLSFENRVLEMHLQQIESCCVIPNL